MLDAAPAVGTGRLAGTGGVLAWAAIGVIGLAWGRLQGEVGSKQTAQKMNVPYVGVMARESWCGGGAGQADQPVNGGDRYST